MNTESAVSFTDQKNTVDRNISTGFFSTNMALKTSHVWSPEPEFLLNRPNISSVFSCRHFKPNILNAGRSTAAFAYQTLNSRHRRPSSRVVDVGKTFWGPVSSSLTARILKQPKLFPVPHLAESVRAIKTVVAAFGQHASRLFSPPTARQSDFIDLLAWILSLMQISRA